MIQSVAAARSATVAVGRGSNRFSSPCRYLPVRTSNAPENSGVQGASYIGLGVVADVTTF